MVTLFGRPFRNIERMNDVLIKNWNQRVKSNDFVIFLGDFMFKESRRAEHFLDRLNGNITFVRGNHDQNNSLNTRIESLVAKVAGQEVFCVHDPANFNNAYRINLVGHIHGYWKVKKIDASFLVNVGVDVWRYNPVSIGEILRAVTQYQKTTEKTSR
jgi:calcineurin-like phosphoesterase family protein